jgi:hypothetical protein
MTKTKQKTKTPTLIHVKANPKHQSHPNVTTGPVIKDHIAKGIRE